MSSITSVTTAPTSTPSVRPVAPRLEAPPPPPKAPEVRADRYVPWNPEEEQALTYERDGSIAGEQKTKGRGRTGTSGRKAAPRGVEGTRPTSPPAAGAEGTSANGAANTTTGVESTQGAAKTAGTKATRRRGAELDPAQQQQVQRLAARDREVRAHEGAHASVGGANAGAPSLTFEIGPDGKPYAIGGEVALRVGGGSTPEEKLRNAEQARRAALAPANPSGQDIAIAAAATAAATEARAQLREENLAAINGEGDPSDPATAVAGSGGQKGERAPTVNGAAPPPIAGASSEDAEASVGRGVGAADSAPEPEALPLPGSGEATPEPPPLPGSGRAAPRLAAIAKAEAEAERKEEEEKEREALPEINGADVATQLNRAGRLEEEFALSAFQKDEVEKPNVLGYVEGADRPASKKDLDSFEIEGRHKRAVSTVTSGSTTVEPPPTEPPTGGGGGPGNGNGNGGGNGNGNGNGRR